ncbi:hypothetical protein M233_07670 [Xylella fastidiosa subsp. multiplex Griffin-1]|nr:hypothetical protein M233_07670 [Xylella fastidiosa subsp. multiplex Griffin-1]
MQTADRQLQHNQVIIFDTKPIQIFTPGERLPKSRKSHASRITHHASRITHHASRITHHASRITHHASRITKVDRKTLPDLMKATRTISNSH